jgi:RNA polymerase sigma-54 factor
MPTMMKQRLDQRQVQKLILAPALQQAIKLLPMTNLELIEVIDEELSENPMLEIEDESTDRKAEAQEAGTQSDSTPEPVPEPATDETSAGGDDLEFESYFQEYFDDGFRSQSSERRELPPLENMLAGTTTLWDHLDWQANLTFHEPAEREISELIIGNINEDGYLTQTTQELAEASGRPAEDVEKVRLTIMQFDPVGVAALDLKECLLAQMDYLQIQDEPARMIIVNHLAVLQKSDYVQLSRLLGCPAASVKYHIEVIKRLDPAPGRKYSEERPAYVVPDIIVMKEGDELKITLNDEGVPRLRINAYYRRLLAKAFKENPDAYRFLKDKMKKALWFLRSLDQRDQTIYKVARYVVGKQKDFLDKGMEFIRPLTLLEIAQDIGVHESTVGRVVANKFIMTPQGVYSLKYFFHKALTGDAGEDVSSLRVKDRIRRLVEAEDKAGPFSDMEIEAILGRENFHIARRTVAKYRKQLKILPSHIRKRKYLMEGTS